MGTEGSMAVSPDWRKCFVEWQVQKSSGRNMAGGLEEKQESVARRRVSDKGRSDLSSYSKDGSFFFAMGAMESCEQRRDSM